MSVSRSLKLLSLMFLALLLGDAVLFTFSPSVEAAGPVYFKWKAYLGPEAGTFIAPLAVDLTGDGIMEIIVTGGTKDYGTDGTVSALEGSTGNIIWQVSPGGIGMHTPFEVADINNDGTMEVVISAQGGALVLHGNDGSTYWRNTDAPAEENYPAIADVNGDGYDEIFVSRGYGPINGIDYITELSYDGAIIAQTPSWHACWGGLTIGDPYSNGTYILYQGDRSYDYNPSEDNYKHGGWGLRALDAVTLTPLWNDSDILCSSHAPMLADVDKTGHLEVIAAWQSSGLVVKNALTGAVDTTGGKYRKNGSLGLSSHSQPTVGDLDGNGNMDIMLSNGSNPIIWDLYAWKKVATLPIVCKEPPKVGNVTGSELGMDIIAVTSWTTYTTIFSYNGGQFVPVQNITMSQDLPSGTLHANAFSLVQDVDGDGFNELVLTTSDGWVYCFGTAGTTTPPARTGFQFYSERKCGVAEYVAPLVVYYPVASFLYEPSEPVVNVTVTFDASHSYDSDGSIATYSWNFGDDTNVIETEPITNHAYTIAGTYTVTLNVTDNVGLTNSSKESIRVGKLNSTISITASPTTLLIKENTTINGTVTPIREGATVTIRYRHLGEDTWGNLTVIATDENSIYSYAWTPSEPGTYELKASWLGDENTFGAESSTITVTRLSPPVPSFTYSPGIPSVGTEMTFDASSSYDMNEDIASYRWDFDDGNISSTVTPITVHTYTFPRTYNVTLTVIDNEGFSSTLMKSIEVIKMNSSISISVSIETITIGENTTGNGSITPLSENVTVTVWLRHVGETTWNVLAEISSDANSEYSYNWTPLQVGNYELMAEWMGDDNTLPAETSAVKCTVIMATELSIMTDCPTAFLGFKIDVSGTLRDTDGNGLKQETVVLYYTPSGIETWTPIGQDTTDDLGQYLVPWMPPATGDFILRVEWLGDSTHSEVRNITAISSLAYQDQYVFSVESNSTISKLAFDTRNWKLSCTTTGPNGTTGYTKVTVAKSLVADITNIRVFLDGKELEFSITSTNDSWLFTFNYANSAHMVSVDLVSARIGDITGPAGQPDGNCDMRDIGLVARNFNRTVPPAPANCDLTGPTAGVPDGIIDMRDTSLIALHYGERYQ